MRDMIQQVIASETEAKQIVAAAQAEAERIAAKAKREAEEYTARVRAEIRAETDQLLASAIEEAGSGKQERLVRARAGIETQVQLDPALRECAVAEVIRCVCGQPGPGKEAP